MEYFILSLILTLLLEVSGKVVSLTKIYKYIFVYIFIQYVRILGT